MAFKNKWILTLWEQYCKIQNPCKAKGQALYETILTLPLFLSIVSFFLFFLYEQIWTVVTEHTLHEALICEKTFKKNKNIDYCLLEAQKHIQNAPFLGQTKVYKLSESYYAEFKVLKNFHWKTIQIRERQ